MTSDAPFIVACPSCRTGWELTPEEAENKTFTCTECQTSFEIRRAGGKEDTAGASPFRRLRGSIILAGVLLGWDALIAGSFTFTFFAGPIWLLFAISKALIWRNDRALSARRVLIPLVTMGLVFGNAWLQTKIARANAEQIIQACAQYRKNNGAYPSKLGDLVPRYLHSVPRAKYALMWGGFDYSVYKGEHSIMWVELPPFGRPFYDFEQSRWGFLD